ncbi:hypothetical protein Tsp_10285, partial [Trichinella spiralis]
MQQKEMCKHGRTRMQKQKEGQEVNADSLVDPVKPGLKDTFKSLE